MDIETHHPHVDLLSRDEWIRRVYEDREHTYQRTGMLVNYVHTPERAWEVRAKEVISESARREQQQRDQRRDQILWATIIVVAILAFVLFGDDIFGNTGDSGHSSTEWEPEPPCYPSVRGCD